MLKLAMSSLFRSRVARDVSYMHFILFNNLSSATGFNQKSDHGYSTEMLDMDN